VPARHWHWEEALLAGSARVLEGQPQHTAAILAATSELNWSAGHTYDTHPASPDAALNVPAAHAVHGPPSAPENPALQRQAVFVVLAVAEFESAGHAWHADSAFPAPALNVLTGHAWQACSVSSPAFMRLTTAAISPAVSSASTAYRPAILPIKYIPPK